MLWLYIVIPTVNLLKKEISLYQKLKSQEIKVIFSVDMFNEGVDIPDLDMVMFLRPTESPVVFLQQLGRGLQDQQRKNIPKCA